MSYELNLNRYLDVVATYGKRYYCPGFLNKDTMAKNGI